ncbi:hypothetical protein ACFYKT_03625 [Cytobacillus sp. FJAT-53684]|uniref:YqgU-like 6-bladed beta-propeller domain-containing protein n=1 Tax=Cytobacillus mangrovibacter TaxID=3299024 RepID=A0ABW6JY64_9BACI
MVHTNRRNYRKVLFLCVFLLGYLVLLTGCTTDLKSGMHSKIIHSKDLVKGTIPSSFTGQEMMLPIALEQGQFNMANGWLNNDTIIYTTNVGLGSHVYTYNVFSGVNQLIYESESPVASVIISPSGNRILIHTVPTTYEGVITIIDAKGKEIMSERMEAFDFVFEWNPYDENILLFSLFTESWDYSTYHLNLEEKKLTPIHLKEPFAHWVSKDELAYLDWGKEQPSLLAPLVKRSLSSEDEKLVLDEVFYMKSIENLIMTITVTSDKINESVYTFLSNDFKELSTFSIPHLTRFSDWLIPYFDFDEKNRLYTFAPLYHSDVDTYAGGFQLLSIESGEKTVILEDLDNEPLSCSPNGTHCLYGFYLEKLIHLDTKEIMPIVKE